MIPSKIATDSPRKTEQVRSGVYVARNSYSGKYVFFRRGDKKNFYLVRLRKTKPRAAESGG